MRNSFTLSIKLISTLAAIFVLTACGVIAPASPTPDVLATVVAQTLTSMPNPEVAASTSTPVAATFTPIPSTFTPIPVSVAATSTPPIGGANFFFTCAENVNLRVNPGRLFQVSRVLAKGTRLQVLGMAPGGQWFNVVNDEGIIGWVGKDFLAGNPNQQNLLVITPTDVLTITGQVLDVNGVPVSGIGFAAVQGDKRDDGVTDAAGMFYIFLPSKFTGAWTTSFVSVACPSTTMDANCNCLNGTCGKPDPEVVTGMLPLSAPLSYVWK